MYTSLLDVVDPSTIDEIKEDQAEDTLAEQLSGMLVTMGSNVDASAAETIAEMQTNTTRPMK